MSRARAVASFALLWWGASACAVDEPKPIASERCAAARGPLSDCGQTPLTGAEDACWRLVQCGAIPAANAESEPTCCFDWATCVAHIEDLPDDQFESTLACIEAASCRELKPRSAAGHTDLPACLDASDRHL